MDTAYWLPSGSKVAPEGGFCVATVLNAEFMLSRGDPESEGHCVSDDDILEMGHQGRGPTQLTWSPTDDGVFML